jgi:hypothetical protein
MMGFFMMLIVIGGLGSLVVTADMHVAHKAPIPLTMLFAGLGFYLISFLALLVEIYISLSAAGVIGFIIAPLLGGFGGGIVGYRLGLRRRRRNSEVVSNG